LKSIFRNLINKCKTWKNNSINSNFENQLFLYKRKRHYIGDLANIPQAFILENRNNSKSFAEMTNDEKAWGFVKCSVNSKTFKLACFGNDDGVALRFLNNGAYEPYSLSIWAEIAKRATLVVDVGAHTGVYSITARLFNSTASIISVEPNYMNVARMALNLRVNGFDTSGIAMAAASQTSGTREFSVPLTFDYQYSGGRILVAEAEHIQKSHGRYIVQATTVDDLVSKFKDPECLIIKIDAEEHEREVILGAKVSIEHHKPIILLECLGSFGGVVIDMIKHQDYRLFVVEEKNRTLIETSSENPLLDGNGNFIRDKINRILIPSSKLSMLESLTSA
jgi:FkbM family methyltransferase